MKVLIVEDDFYISRMFGRAFKDSGYELELAGDGAIAWHALSSGDIPAIVLLDERMPNMDGEALLKKMKADDKLKDLPVIVLTNQSLDKGEKNYLSLNADMYLVKMDHPPQEVVKITGELLASRQAKKK